MNTFCEKNVPDLIKRLKAAYPDGTTCSLNTDMLKNDERDERIRVAIQNFCGEFSLHWGTSSHTPLAYDIHLSQAASPNFDHWVGYMDNAAKIDWIRKNGEPYPVLWLKISKVIDFYYLYFNHWTPRDDTGYLDADCDILPDEQWQRNQRILELFLKKYGFEYFSDEMAKQTTELVKMRDYDSIPDNDPRWDDIDFEPPWVDATLHECLFSY